MLCIVIDVIDISLDGLGFRVRRVYLPLGFSGQSIVLGSYSCQPHYSGTRTL